MDKKPDWYVLRNIFAVRVGFNHTASSASPVRARVRSKQIADELPHRTVSKKSRCKKKRNRKTKKPTSTLYDRFLA